MQSKKQLIRLGEDGDLALKSADGSLEKLPEWQTKSAQSFVYLVIDCSGSMAGKKIEQARRGSIDFAKSAFNDGYLVGLISFSDQTFHLCSPLNNIDELTSVVDRLSIQGGTNMAPAIDEVVSQFSRKADSFRAMVIVTDGQTSEPQSALRSAERAKRLGISILTIGTDDADSDFLAKLASEKNLAKKVRSDYLEESISQTAKLLPRGF